MRIVVVVGLLIGLDVTVAVVVWPRQHPAHPGIAAAVVADRGWAALDPTARCAQAAAVVTYPIQWPMVCRWRIPADTAVGIAFPPPVGEPPWDRPRIELYLAPSQGRIEVAHVIAHELGHMHHTRASTIGNAWLAARGLPADTPWQVWVEDYAESFAAVFGPAVNEWDASTPRPSSSALAVLKAQFFEP